MTQFSLLCQLKPRRHRIVSLCQISDTS